jgi:hypothetical protein
MAKSRLFELRCKTIIFLQLRTARYSRIGKPARLRLRKTIESQAGVRITTVHQPARIV